MENEQPKWKSINMGEILPCQSFLRKKDGEILKLSTIGGVKVGQDCYYLPVDEVINVIKDYPVEDSKDERIINNIRKVIGWQRGMFTEKSLMPEQYQEIDAWLEKQGEHAKFRDSIQVGDKVTRNQDGMLVNLSQLNRVAKKDEKQGEKDKFIEKELECIKGYREKAIKMLEELEKQGGQKPADKVEPKFKVGDVMRTLEEAKEGITDGLPVVVSIDEEYYHCNNELISIKDQDKYEYPPMNRKQKYAEWSEEDEWCLEQINFLIRNSYSVDDKVERLSNWVKSIKDRLLPQPKQEWSEEDEKMYNVVHDLAWEAYKTSRRLDIPTFGIINDWLKSLRPQNWTKEDKDRYISCLQRLSTGNPEQPETINSKWFKEHVYPQSRWKPSATDIQVLEDVIDRGRSPINYHATLHVILEHLKKLMEE